jgi:hypothetical protein
MNRLITFGCSNTFGEALSDTIKFDNNKKFYDETTPSKFAWPQVLANDLNLKCCNLAQPGCSNKFICNKVLNTEFKNTDIVVIMWTFFSRFCFFQDDGSQKRIMIQDVTNRNISKDRVIYNSVFYKTFYTDYDLVNDSFLRINHIKMYLDNLNIRNFHFTCHNKNNYNDLDIDKKIPSWNKVDLIKIRFTDDVADDKMHPGVLSHISTAKKIKNILDKNLD